MNKSPSRSLIKECDGLIQAIACLSPCAIQGFQAQVGHHIIGRKNMFFRHDLRNIVPLLHYQHTGASPVCAELQPKNFATVMTRKYPQQMEWAQAHRHEYHKAPNREALLATRDKLRAFLAKGEPYQWRAADTLILRQEM